MRSAEVCDTRTLDFHVGRTASHECGAPSANRRDSEFLQRCGPKQRRDAARRDLSPRGGHGEGRPSQTQGDPPDETGSSVPFLGNVEVEEGSFRTVLSEINFKTLRDASLKLSDQDVSL